MLPGARVEFSIHYHAVGEEITDQLEAGWWFHPRDVTPKYSASFISLGSSNSRPLHIPPHSETVHQGSYTLPAPAIIHNFQPHMHYRGKAFSLEAIYPDGRRELLNHADRFSNDWHVNYVYDPDYAPLLPRGTVLQITAWARQHGRQPQQSRPAPVGVVRAAHGGRDGPLEHADHLHRRRRLRADHRRA